MAASKKKTEAVQQAPEYKCYRLLHLMNVRKAPSLEAPVSKTMSLGTRVTAQLINGWLALKSGGYILFDNGQYAQEED